MHSCNHRNYYSLKNPLFPDTSLIYCGQLNSGIRNVVSGISLGTRYGSKILHVHTRVHVLLYSEQTLQECSISASYSFRKIIPVSIVATASGYSIILGLSVGITFRVRTKLRWQTFYIAYYIHVLRHFFGLIAPSIVSHCPFHVLSLIILSCESGRLLGGTKSSTHGFPCSRSLGCRTPC